jgi:hypothetical protein
MPTTPHRAPWSSTYRISSESRQQRILRTIHRLDHPGIKALGTTRDSDCVIVIECTSAADEVRSRQIVMALDLLAVRTETTRASRVLYDEDAAATAYLSGLAIPRRLLKLVPTDRLRKLL